MRICVNNHGLLSRSVQFLNDFDFDRKKNFYAKTDVKDCAFFYSSLKKRIKKDITFYEPHVRNICIRKWGFLPSKLIPLNGGTFQLLFRAFYSHDKDFIIRINKLKDYKIGWIFLIEEYIYNLLNEKGISTPLFLESNFSRSLCPSDYQILNYVQGDCLTKFQSPKDQFMHPELLMAVGRYIANIHKRFYFLGFGPISLSGLATGKFCGIHIAWKDYIFLRLKEHIEICKKIGAINSFEEQIIFDLFKEYENCFGIKRGCLLHGDLGHRNFISKDGKTISALIDWEDAMIGDSVFDIAFWGTFLRDYLREDFLLGYKEVYSLPGDFELLYWIYYLRIALSKTVHRFHFNYADLPGRPKASSRIQKAINNIRGF